MVTLIVETWIKAPQQRCFDLARSQSAHIASAKATGERIVEGPQNDLLVEGDALTFEAKHLGFKWSLSARIESMSPPSSFLDEQTRGPFARMRHEHRFDSVEGGTMMTDIVEFAAPLGPLGWLAERLFLKPHLLRFLTSRGQFLKAMAEQPH